MGAIYIGNYKRTGPKGATGPVFLTPNCNNNLWVGLIYIIKSLEKNAFGHP
jgi:hypothetical protein